MDTNVMINNENFTYNFNTSKTPEDVFRLLLDIKQWWRGLHGETIKGPSQKVNDEFTFEAGGGAHYSKQKLIDLIPGKKIVWLITDSKLNFLSDTGEWTGTKICFDISNVDNMTKVAFTHKGLIPQIECYNGCSGAWTTYLEKLEQKLNEA